MFTVRLSRRVLALTLTALSLLTAHPAHALPPPDAVSMAGTASVSGLAIAPEARPASDSVLHLSFALKSSRLSGVDAFLASQRDPKSPNYHHSLTPQQFGARFGASDADITAVTAFARAHGMAVTNVWPNKLFVSVDSTVSGAEAAFGVQINGYRRAEGNTVTGTATFYAPNHAPLLSRDVASRLDAVFGLDNFLVAQPAFRSAGGAKKVINAMVPRAPVAKVVDAAKVSDAAVSGASGRALPAHPGAVGGAAPSFSSAMTPDNISTFYEFDPLHSRGFSGQSQTIAVFSPSGFNTGDLAYFASYYGRTGYTLNVINVDGGNTDLTNQLEPALDTEVIIGQARYSTINLYEEPNSGTGFQDGFNKIASDNLPVVSCSWAYDEHYLHSNGFDSFLNSLHTIFNQMASQGMAIYASTGDNGAVVGTDGTNVAYPASDPNVTAVGGTNYLVDSSSAFVSEQGWSGSGGGRSVYFDTPGYQSGPGVANSYSNGKRQLPDVSAAGGPTPGYSVRAGGNWYSAYGTSASTPLWATANVLINQGTASLGFGSRSYGLNPFLYDIGRNLNGYNDAEVYHDSTTGNNGYPTTAKWDFVTGWGSPRFAKLYNNDVYRANYTYYTPGGGWTSPILVSTTSSTASEPTYLNNLTTYYIGYAFWNASIADGRAETARLTIDGANYDINYGDLPSYYYFGHYNGHAQTLALGSHTISLTADVNGNVAETNESDNSYSRTITVRPYNDPFIFPFYISGDSGTNYGTNSYASIESGEPNHGNRTPSASVWWYWTAPSTRTYTFNTYGSNYDTTLGVYTGSAVNALTSVAQNDDAGGGSQSSVAFLATAGQVYRIAVDGYNGHTGNIQLNWGTAAPSNDNFVAAQGISGASGSTTGSSIGATKESGEPNHGGRTGGASIWYAWTAPSTGQWTFNTAGSDYDTLLGVYTGSSVSALTTIAGNDDYASTYQSSVTFLATAGTVYYIAVDGFSGAGGNVHLAWANSLPTVTSLSPTSTPSGGLAFTLYVYGTNFVPTSVVKWNGGTRPTTFYSATALGATISATDIHNAGSVTVAVTTPKVTTTSSLTFTITQGGSTAPTITSLSPSSATAGGAAFTLTVNGTNFASNSVVKWNGSSRTTTYVSATKLTAAIKAPDIATAGNIPVTVTTPMVGTSGAVNFTVKTPTPPTLTSLSPKAKAAGATTFSLAVNGTNFASNSIVKWNGSSRTTTYVSATKLTATINTSDLVNAGDFPITVTTPSVGTSNAITFSVQAITLGVGTITRGSPGLTVPITLTNTTPNSLSGVTITTAQLGGKNTTSSLPVSLGTMASGVSKSATFVFPGSAGASGTTVNLLISGSYSGGGTFLSNKPVVLP